MVDVSRRLFLGGALAIAAASIVPVADAEATTGPIPKIVGDGIHDDTEGLQALIDGRPVCIDGECIRVSAPTQIGPRTIWFEPGSRFKISTTLTLSDDSLRLTGSGVRVTASDKFPPYLPMVKVHGPPIKNATGFRFTSHRRRPR